MQTRQLGSEGPLVSEIGFGGWAIGGGWGEQRKQDSVEALHAALDGGVTLIDTAAGYGDGRSEQVIAEVLQDRNQDVFVATKTPPTEGIWPPSPYCRWQDRYPAAYLRENVHQRLVHLQRERIDLLQLHTWTRAWNDDPQPLLVLRQLKDEGKIGMIGLSTPEHDQACVIQLMRDGLVDVIQVIFNLFDQEAAAQILPVAAETGTGVIVRVPLDEGALSGKFTEETSFESTDFRSRYFRGERLPQTLSRVQQIREDVEKFELQERYSLVDVALKFVLARPEVSSVIVGMRNRKQAELNCRTAQLKDLPESMLQQLRRHNWRRGIWYG